ncbi:MAG: hypothetical protein ACRDL7_00455, partial [Gaiellaceae bacterium]
MPAATSEEEAPLVAEPVAPRLGGLVDISGVTTQWCGGLPEPTFNKLADKDAVHLSPNQLRPQTPRDSQRSHIYRCSKPDGLVEFKKDGGNFNELTEV